MRFTSLSLTAVAFIASGITCGAIDPEPALTASFDQAIEGMAPVATYLFGTGPGRTVRSLDDLAADFDPYGIAGRTVIHKEWEVYQPFNRTNFVLSAKALNLTATIGRGTVPHQGGIHSGQIWTKATYTPGRTGYSVYAIDVRMRIPRQRGAWPAAWLYAKQTGKSDPTDGSEIDNPEFLINDNQDSYDWTGFQHGPKAGAELFSLKTNPYVWHPGVDFAARYHDYQTVWTPTRVYKYVDGKLVYASCFEWTSQGNAQLGINLAVGTSATEHLQGLQPTSKTKFPIVLSVESVRIWGR